MDCPFAPKVDRLSPNGRICPKSGIMFPKVEEFTLNNERTYPKKE
jgi:hypothetical protein